ncbi:MAG: hypothetical protein BJ554DRAFT_7876 [Olpidium bornovanus]|uniref:Uncharacterized protein n=1 Tax=Olpidium bornovanus TaxID=278681 RepID=A0A8H8DIR9_9FUNG|nr:MAG: hypothetical protein BJ554DRAFT_7876 [Olpidium bornovanus]
MDPARPSAPKWVLWSLQANPRISSQHKNQLLRLQQPLKRDLNNTPNQRARRFEKRSPKPEKILQTGARFRRSIRSARHNLGRSGGGGGSPVGTKNPVTTTTERNMKYVRSEKAVMSQDATPLGRQQSPRGMQHCGFGAGKVANKLLVSRDIGRYVAAPPANERTASRNFLFWFLRIHVGTPTTPPPLGSPAPPPSCSPDPTRPFPNFASSFPFSRRNKSPPVLRKTPCSAGVRLLRRLRFSGSTAGGGCTCFLLCFRDVRNEAECRKQCAASPFAAIQVRLVGLAVNGLCRCGNEPPAVCFSAPGCYRPFPGRAGWLMRAKRFGSAQGAQNGVCSTPCATGGNCGGTGVEAILDIAAGDPAPQPNPAEPALPARGLVAPSLLAPALETPALGAPALGAPALGAPALGAPALGTPAVAAPNGTSTGLPAPPTAAPIPARQPRQPVRPTNETVASPTVTKQVRTAPTESSGGLPSSLLITGGTILGVILLVPFVVVSCLRYQRRRVNAEKPELPYNSTAKRLRPVSSTMFLEEPPAFPEMRASRGSVNSPSPVSSAYRMQPNYPHAPSPSPLSLGPTGMGGYFVPTNTHSVYSRPVSKTSSSFSSQGSQNPPDGHIPASQPLAFNHSVAPQVPVVASTTIYASDYGGYDEVSPGPAQSQVYIGAGNNLNIVPQLPFDIDYDNFNGVVPTPELSSGPYITNPEQEETGHYAPP